MKHLVLLVVFLLMSSVGAPAQQPSPILPKMIDQVRGSVVEITVALRRNVSVPPSTYGAACFREGVCIVGTGFFVDDKGDVVTADHVLEDVNKVIQALAGIGIQADSSITAAIPNYENERVKAAWNYVSMGFVLRDQDTIHDIAILSPTDPSLFTRIDRFIHIEGVHNTTNPTAVIFDLKRPRDGDGVYACGYPQSAESLTTTSGSVATAWGSENLVTAQRHGSTENTEIYRLDLRANPGISGGPIFAIDTGRLIGMAVKVLQGPGGSTGIVLPSHYIAELLQKNQIPWRSSAPTSQSQ